MVTLENLKRIVILTHLTDEMIYALQPFIVLTRFEEKDIIFQEGEPSEIFYMLKRGKVLLELRLSDKVTVSVGSIEPGYAFGWSAMLENATYTTDAVCAEPCEVFAISGSALKNVLESNFEMGYRFTRRLLVLMKKRLDIKSEQLIRAIKNHPDMQHLL